MAVEPHASTPLTFGLLAEFGQPEPLLDAVLKTRESGYSEINAYTPFPVEGLSEALGFTRDRVALITLAGGVSGGAFGYLMQWYANVVDYPWNVAGRPFHSWPAFIPVIFELTVLGASLAAAFGMLALNKLPQPYHPVFNEPRFLRCSKDRFFLLIKASDRLYHSAATRRFLLSLAPLSVMEVPHEP